MADNCNLAGKFDPGLEGCIISFSTTSSTEFVGVCNDTPLEGATTGTISISGYGDEVIWTGKKGRAGVTIPYLRKYDCVNDRVHFVFQGRGQSFYTEGADVYVSLYKKAENDTVSVNASSSGGPVSLVENTTQTNGYGMTYKGGPIGFTTEPEGTVISVGAKFSDYVCYLNGFTLELTPGSLPVATYSLVFAPKFG